jgi:16S rRNA G966 N2-methylase RsmD
VSEQKIIEGDCLEVMRGLDSDSVDLVCTDPPYGYSFMGKDWDRAVPTVEVWKECLRVLKPGAFAFVMSAPRSDVQCAMISRLQEAGFRCDFTPIYWTYASGFPKAANMGKKADEKLGVESEIVSEEKFVGTAATLKGKANRDDWYDQGDGGTFTPTYQRKVGTSEAGKKRQGSYGGFQPKPAVEVIIVAMKPLSEKTFIDQALKNGKGVTWLDDCRIPGTVTTNPLVRNAPGFQSSSLVQGETGKGTESSGRFPANILVSDDVLNDGVERASGKMNGLYQGPSNHSQYGNTDRETIGDSGSYSRYFDLDAWARTLPFLIVPKASKREKNAGCEALEERLAAGLPLRSADGDREGIGVDGTATDRVVKMKNHHPTVKPLKLMSYLITLGSRENEIVLDPFAGSGTTILAAKQMGRNATGIEISPEYCEIARKRLHAEV